MVHSFINSFVCVSARCPLFIPGQFFFFDAMTISRYLHCAVWLVLYSCSLRSMHNHSCILRGGGKRLFFESLEFIIIKNSIMLHALLYIRNYSTSLRNYSYNYQLGSNRYSSRFPVPNIQDDFYFIFCKLIWGLNGNPH